MATIAGLEDIIKACEEAEALGWKSVDYFARSEGDADMIEKVLKKVPQYEYTRRRTNFEIRWVQKNTEMPSEMQNMSQNGYFDNPVEEMLSLFGL